MIPGLTLRAFKQRENASRMLRSRRREIGSGESSPPEVTQKESSPGSEPNERVLAHLLQRGPMPERRKSRRVLRRCKYNRVCFLIKRMR